MDEIQQFVPIAGVGAAIAIWLRQYWFQQRLTNDIIVQLRKDNEVLRIYNDKLSRQNIILRSNATEVALDLISNLEEHHDQLPTTDPEL